MQFRPLKSTAIFLWTQCTSFGAEQCATCINICTAVHCSGRIQKTKLVQCEALHSIHQTVCVPETSSTRKSVHHLSTRHSVNQAICARDTMSIKHSVHQTRSGCPLCISLANSQSNQLVQLQQQHWHNWCNWYNWCCWSNWCSWAIGAIIQLVPLLKLVQSISRFNSLLQLNWWCRFKWGPCSNLSAVALHSEALHRSTVSMVLPSKASSEQQYEDYYFAKFWLNSRVMKCIVYTVQCIVAWTRSDAASKLPSNIKSMMADIHLPTLSSSSLDLIILYDSIQS